MQKKKKLVFWWKTPVLAPWGRKGVPSFQPKISKVVFDPSLTKVKASIDYMDAIKTVKLMMTIMTLMVMMMTTVVAEV